MLRYNRIGNDPANIHWIQFITTDYPRPGTTAKFFVDDEGNDNNPYYDTNGAANNTGFFDFVGRPTRNTFINWRADLFVVQ